VGVCFHVCIVCEFLFYLSLSYPRVRDGLLVQASIAANTYVVSSDCDKKNIQDLLPGILPHLGTDNVEHLKSIAGSMNQDGTRTALPAAGQRSTQHVLCAWVLLGSWALVSRKRSNKAPKRFTPSLPPGGVGPVPH